METPSGLSARSRAGRRVVFVVPNALGVDVMADTPVARLPLALDVARVLAPATTALGQILAGRAVVDAAVPASRVRRWSCSELSAAVQDEDREAVTAIPASPRRAGFSLVCSGGSGTAAAVTGGRP